MDRYMEMALKLAKKAEPFPNPKVGAVLVKGGQVIGSGYHRKAGMPHAEIEAIEDARRHGHEIAGSTLYVTLEPCSHSNKRTPPCTKAIITNGIKQVVFAMRDPNPLVSGRRELAGAGVAVRGPTDEKMAASINRKYIMHITRKPFVAIKMAMSADGKTATRTGDSKWISSGEARELVMEMRSKSDAIIVGSGTVNIDNPRLTARTKGARNPYRIIVDGDLCISHNSKIMKNPDGKTFIATTERAAKREKGFGNLLVCGKDRVDMKKLILGLGAMGMRRILIEGGSGINASALDSGIVDMLYLFIAPKIMGGKDAKGVFGGEGAALVKNSKKIKKMRSRKVGKDILLECWL
ncbi:MAG: bifunctional diaminohydroxyphosphoribosylaminopyrimidine deaminase/5-amino-6-(5-phosphoribosylamino)uracil reductase RibD [Candidatus Micrarchaeota archaeon]